MSTIQNIVEGKGLEEITRIGWRRFREILATIQYADIVKEQARQIQELQGQLSSASVIDQELLRDANRYAHTKAMKLERQCIGRLDGVLQRDTFYASRFDNKLSVKGHENMFDIGIVMPATRFYIGPPLHETPRLFKELIHKLRMQRIYGHEGDIFKYVDLSLNFDTFHLENHLYNGNAIIIYVADLLASDVKAKVMEGVAMAISKSIDKVTQQSPFPHLHAAQDEAKARYLSQIREEAVMDLLVPLRKDAMVGMVEVLDSDTYHTHHLPYILSGMGLTSAEIFQDTVKNFKPVGYLADVQRLRELAQKLRDFNPAAHPSFAKYLRDPRMPSLIMDSGK